MDRRGYPPPEAFGRGESQRRFNRKITGALHCLCHTQGTRLETALNSAAEGEGEMRATKLQELEEMAAKLLATVRKLPPGPDRHNILQEIGRFRAQIFSLQGVGMRPARRGLKAKGK